MNIHFSAREPEVMVSSAIRAKFDDPVAFEPFFGSSFLVAAHRRLFETLLAECEEE